MTTGAIRRAFEKLQPSDQAVLLRELAGTLAASLQDVDDKDNAVFESRRHEEPLALPWAEMKARLGSPVKKSMKRNPRRSHSKKSTE